MNEVVWTSHSYGMLYSGVHDGVEYVLSRMVLDGSGNWTLRNSRVLIHLGPMPPEKAKQAAAMYLTFGGSDACS